MDSSDTSSADEPITSTRSPSSQVAEATPLSRVGMFAFTLAGGLAIFLFGSPFFNVYPTNDNVAYGWALIAFFGLCSLVLEKWLSSTHYSSCAYALFIAAVANLVLTIGPFNWLITSSDSYQEITQDKLAQFLAIVPVIVLLTWARKRPLSSIYIQVGQARRWLGFGLVWIVLGTIGLIGIADAYDVDSDTLLAAAPWILLFVALNATMEELWFRAIFLRAYSTAMGGGLAILVTALVFGIAHVNAEYMTPGEMWTFGFGVFVIGLVAAWAMRWANSLWGSVLFHMGMGLMITIQIVESV